MKFHMRKNLVSFFLLAVFIAFLVSGCSISPVGSQLKQGIWASEKGLWDEAIFRWKKALALNPNSVAAHNNLAIAYEQKGLGEEAIKEYELALKLDPKNPHVKSNYQRCKENLGLSKKEINEKK